ncbi:efflux RND transporter periplasmic adaptor subunit [Maribacter sp. IgM3_T14_3]|uniref:efflux RND transporter periplasmic adaptor subunit n=1 Tax=Maribacter sp. IgM3_T14_3 TaxID=3415140 RepID=UPI003C6EB6A3
MESLAKYKKYAVYLVVLLFGLLLGYWFFGESDTNKSIEVENSVDKITFTCSMHPNVDSDEKGTCPICRMDLVKRRVDFNTQFDNSFQMSERAVALANVQTSIIGFSAQNGQVTLSGEITSNDKTNATQTTLFDGRLDKLEVNYIGEYVRKGQVIGTIYSPDLYLAQDKLLTSASYKDTHEKLYAAARNTLGLWKLTDKQIDDLLKSGKPIQNFPLVADVAGTVVEIIASEGNYFKQGDPLFKVSRLSTVWAVFQAYENQMPLLKIGQQIEIVSEAFKGTSLKATISFIEPLLDRGSRVVSVRADISNKDGKWKPGMFVEGKVNVEGADEKLLMVPKSAVLWTGERSVVYKKVNANIPEFEMLQVQLGESVGKNYIVLEGLQTGDEIVTNGAFVIDAAAQLQGKNSMMYSNNLEISQNAKHEEHLNKLTLEQNQNLKEALKVYFDFKDALVESNSINSTLLAEKLYKALVLVNQTGMDNNLQGNIKSALTSLVIIEKSKDLEKNRLEFKNLSNAIIFISSQITDYGNPIYIQHCPMADNNTGGDWLSLDKAIKNPYFGDKMLTCGSIIKVIN